MSEIDPRTDLQQVLRLCNRLDLPESARNWVTTTLEAVDPIMKFVDHLASKGYPIPDEVLKFAFKRVHLIARCWIAHDREAEIVIRYGQENGWE